MLSTTTEMALYRLAIGSGVVSTHNNSQSIHPSTARKLVKLKLAETTYNPVVPRLTLIRLTQRGHAWVKSKKEIANKT